MASVNELMIDFVQFEDDIRRKECVAEATRYLYFIAARRIQAWIRGILTRNHLRLLHESAIIIQRHWRGYCARIIFEQCMIQSVHQMWQEYYDKMAIKIQAFWRGYWLRKTVLDIKKMHCWLNEVYEKNEETVNNMKRFRNKEIEYVQKIMEEESMQWILFILFKLHHLLRTTCRPGVITKIDNAKFTFIEAMLKCLQYKHYIRNKKLKPKEKKCQKCQIDEKPSLILRGTYYEKCEKEIREIQKRLEAEAMPLYRSEPYDEHEKSMRKVNHMRILTALEETYDSNVKKREEQKTTCSLRKEFEQGACYVNEDSLLEKIEKMDCHLNRLHLKCPVHDSST